MHIWNMWQKAVRQRSERKKQRRDYTNMIERSKFEHCSRYQRRGVVIAHRQDQMQSMIIQPDFDDVFVFRIYVHSNNRNYSF